MSIEFSGLELTIRRMQSIEQRFQALTQTAPVQQVDKDFKQIFETAMNKVEHSNNISDMSTDTNRADIDELIEKYSEKNGLDKNFVKALIKQESGFQTSVTSPCGAMGLMQLMPATAESLGVNNAYDAEENIAGGTKYLKGLLDRFSGNKELALAAYNAGPNAVKKYNGVPPYKETQNYVKNIISSYQRMNKGGV